MVVLTVSDEETDVLEPWRPGRAAIILKDTRADRPRGGIRQAAEGHMVLSAEIAQALMEHVRAGVNAARAEA